MTEITFSFLFLAQALIKKKTVWNRIFMCRASSGKSLSFSSPARIYFFVLLEVLCRTHHVCSFEILRGRKYFISQNENIISFSRYCFLCPLFFVSPSLAFSFISFSNASKSNGSRHFHAPSIQHQINMKFIFPFLRK